MAAPTDPTLTLLATEAYKKIGILTPTSAELTRASDYFFEEVLDEIWNAVTADGNTRLKTLQTEVMAISTKGKRTYDIAEAFDEEVSVTIWDGSNRGTAQAGATGSLTLASSDTVTEARIVGKYLLLTGGTGSGQYRQVTAYNTGTLVATVDSNWSTTPDNTSTYLIVERTWTLTEENEIDLVEQQPASLGRPSYFAKYGRQLIFNRPFDLSTYGIFIRYFMNVHQVDRTEGASTMITRILRNWRSAVTYGLAKKIAEAEGDTMAKDMKAEFDRATSSLVVREIPYGGEFEGFTL